ncbi:MAG: glycoside hydrolase family 99-like domain-containing protein [Lachnospiraceae bacterium]|nr:glycoside hydrolase family 99-like domain-containing protein [Lachnospiraceae bacterium]
MKIISFYVPQYHVIPENDEWWGKGFTEWVNVRRGKPLFSNHYQPREPLNDYYYDLTDKNTLRWQADLASKYGVYGFCFYHYWFGDKLLLEKPMELLLANPDINIKYCVCWANEPWTNAWKAGNNCKTLMPQRYGSVQEWKAHFDYLLPFFKDERYIKIDNKPMVLIYRTEIIDCLEEMVKFLNQKAVENGFDGLTFISQHPSSENQSEKRRLLMDYQVQFEPISSYRFSDIAQSHLFLKTIKRRLSDFLEKHTKFNLNNINPYKLQKLDYDKTWETILATEADENKIPGGFVDWDNTARRGDKGKVYYGASPDKFYKYMVRLIRKARQEYKKDYIFLTAWNEWGEGSYLEPDKKFQYGYLEALNRALSDTGEL